MTSREKFLSALDKNEELIVDSKILEAQAKELARNYWARKELLIGKMNTFDSLISDNSRLRNVNYYSVDYNDPLMKKLIVYNSAGPEGMPRPQCWIISDYAKYAIERMRTRTMKEEEYNYLLSISPEQFLEDIKSKRDIPREGELNEQTWVSQGERFVEALKGFLEG